VHGQSLEEGYFTFGSSRTGVIAHVHPETSISKQQTGQTQQSGEPIWQTYHVRQPANDSNPRPGNVSDWADRQHGMTKSWLNELSCRREATRRSVILLFGLVFR